MAMTIGAIVFAELLDSIFSLIDLSPESKSWTPWELPWYNLVSGIYHGETKDPFWDGLHYNPILSEYRNLPHLY